MRADWSKVCYYSSLELALMMESSLTTPYHRIAFPLLAFYDLTRARRAPRQVIKLGSKTISRVNSVKYLGILIYSKLTWKPYITELSKKLARTVGILFKMRHFATIEISKLLYYSLFNSFISYGICFWGLTHPINLKALRKLQKSCHGLLILHLYFTDSKYSN